MPDDVHKEAGQRFAADLRSRCEEQGLTEHDLCQKLGVPGRLFQVFESGGLASQPLFNRVYLRSLIRSYAAIAKVPPAAALAALEAVLEGAYEPGQLDREVEAHEPVQGPSGEASGPADSSARAEAAVPAAEEQPQPDWTAQSPPDASAAEAERRQREKEDLAHERERERQERARTQQREDRPPQRKRRGSSSAGSSWAIAGLAVAALAVAGFFLVRSLGDGADPETAQSSAATADTAGGGQARSRSQDQRSAANLQLGEQMNFTVVAQEGGVQGIRITRDEDVRRPYWIQEGQAQVFPARKRIVLEETAQLDKIRLLAEGYPYPTSRRDEQGRIVITRKALRAFADTLQGQRVPLSAPPDTIPKGNPADA